MRRRDILAGAGSLATAASLSFPAPAIAQGIRQLKMVTDWPAGSPGLQSSAARLAQRIGTASGGRINIEGPAGALVRAFETFDAVGAGVADMYHSAEYYWEKKSPALYERWHMVSIASLRSSYRRPIQLHSGRALARVLARRNVSRPTHGDVCRFDCVSVGPRRYSRPVRGWTGASCRH
jgi:hypothetical protein